MISSEEHAMLSGLLHGMLDGLKAGAANRTLSPLMLEAIADTEDLLARYDHLLEMSPEGMFALRESCTKLRELCQFAFIVECGDD